MDEKENTSLSLEYPPPIELEIVRLIQENKIDELITKVTHDPQIILHGLVLSKTERPINQMRRSWSQPMLDYFFIAYMRMCYEKYQEIGFLSYNPDYSMIENCANFLSKIFQKMQTTNETSDASIVKLAFIK